MPTEAFGDIREQARAEFDPSRIEGISGSDIDPEAVELANRHLKQAGWPDASVSRQPICAIAGAPNRRACFSATRLTANA